MIDHRPPPPPAETCLLRAYASRGLKGGTLIAEAVTELAAHEKALSNGSYRPARCEPCGAAMHLHDYRLRILAASDTGTVTVVRFRCADRDSCGAVFLVLPAFVARHLWREWATVERTTQEGEGAEGAEGKPPVVPARTVSRWRARLAATAAALVVAFASASFGAAIAEEVGLGGTRAKVVAQYAKAMAAEGRPQKRGLLYACVAALVHRAAPGIRLM